MSIAAYIKEDLAARVKSGQALPAQLTLDSLAGHYNVSFTPVRAAVAELVVDGVLEKGANRRLTAAPQLRAGKGTRRVLKLPDPPRNPFDDVASDLVQLSLQGKPVYLREEVTAEKYNVSRTVIRHVFHRLAGEGMLEHMRRRGWQLRPFRQVDLRAFIEVRELMELKAIQLSAPKLDNGELQRILDLNRLPDSSDEIPHVDDSLHDYLVATADNRYITDFFERGRPYYRLLLGWVNSNRTTAIRAIRQHRKILTALLRKKWSTARKELSNHILTNHAILSDLVGKQEATSKTD